MARPKDFHDLPKSHEHIMLDFQYDLEYKAYLMLEKVDLIINEKLKKLVKE